MRGKVHRPEHVAMAVRITPAYAGKSANVTLAGSSGWDHPRLCGEKVAETETIATEIGSPPPMRGKDMEHLIRMWLDRITPAYAGKRYFMQDHFVYLQDHPRLCGEKIVPVTPHLVIGGSPPPMRGKADQQNAMQREIRITPAYAGKSFCCCSVQAALLDHPRLCGEKSLLVSRRPRFLGSPPPMRGKGA